MDIQGKIQDVKVETGMSKANKPYKRFVFTIEDKKFSTFDEDIGSKFKQGDTVLMRVEQNGKFLNMKSMELVEGIETVKVGAKPDLPQLYSTMEQCRYWSLDMATKTALLLGAEKITVDGLIEIAKLFEDYIRGLSENAYY